MRRLASSSSSWIAGSLALVATLAVVQGCGDSEATSAFEAPPDAAGAPTAPGEGQGSDLISDGGGSPAALFRGSPLCRVTAATCNPDDDGTTKAYAGGGLACAVAPGDGGTISDPKGCRLGGATGDPECLEANPENGDGAKCTEGSQCAPGFDCVVGMEGGVCRRYCCGGTCASNRSQNGGDTFCDVQKLQTGGAKVPVCMPIKTCKLFLQGECADTETCGIVAEDGTTGCVANGAARAGESCDQEHCNVGLTCLGQPGSRKCYQLCRTKGSPSCGPTQVCQTSTIFSDPTVGVCDDA